MLSTVTVVVLAVVEVVLFVSVIVFVAVITGAYGVIVYTVLVLVVVVVIVVSCVLFFWLRDLGPVVGWVGRHGWRLGMACSFFPINFMFVYFLYFCLLKLYDIYYILPSFS